MAVGGTRIEEWQPGNPYFNRFIEALELTKTIGLTAVLWHQGESDHPLSQQAYLDYLQNIITTSRSQSKLPDIPWLVATASLQEHKISEEIREAQQETIDPSNNIFPGPDTDVIGMEHRDSIFEVHFTREGNLQAAELWLDSLDTFLSQSN